MAKITTLANYGRNNYQSDFDTIDEVISHCNREKPNWLIACSIKTGEVLGFYNGTIFHHKTKLILNIEEPDISHILSYDDLNSKTIDELIEVKKSIQQKIDEAEQERQKLIIDIMTIQQMKDLTSFRRKE